MMGKAPDSIDLARELQREIESRGGTLVLFQVPSPLVSHSNAREIAAALQAPLLEVRDETLTLTDAAHLDSRSSRAFVEQLATGLSSLPEVDRIVRVSRGMSR